METKPDARLYGENEAGCWMVYASGHSRDEGFGPFETRTEAATWMAQFDNRPDMYAVNLTDLPNWWNV